MLLLLSSNLLYESRVDGRCCVSIWFMMLDTPPLAPSRRETDFPFVHHLHFMTIFGSAIFSSKYILILCNCVHLTWIQIRSSTTHLICPNTYPFARQSSANKHQQKKMFQSSNRYSFTQMFIKETSMLIVSQHELAELYGTIHTKTSRIRNNLASDGDQNPIWSDAYWQLQWL